LLPGFSAAQVADYAAQPGARVLENSDRIQAVRQESLGLTAANFWQDGRSTVGDISVDKKASVLVQHQGEFLHVGVCDPTQLNPGTITVEIATPAVKLISADAGVTIDRLSPTIRLSVGVKDAAGRTFHARFLTGAP